MQVCFFLFYGLEYCPVNKPEDKLLDIAHGSERSLCFRRPSCGPRRRYVFDLSFRLCVRNRAEAYTVRLAVDF